MDIMKNNNSIRGSRVESTIILIHPAKSLSVTKDLSIKIFILLQMAHKNSCS